MMDTQFNFMSLEKLILLKGGVKREILRKEKKIDEYMQCRLRKYLFDDNISESLNYNIQPKSEYRSQRDYIVNNIEIIRLSHQWLHCRIYYLEKDSQISKHTKRLHTTCEIYTETSRNGQVQEHICCYYKKASRSCSYDFCQGKVLHSAKHSISRQGFDQFLDFSKWVSKKGIFQLLDDLWKIKQSIIKHPILETRDACLTFLLCCKFGGLPLSRDTARLIAQKLWETRYQ